MTVTTTNLASFTMLLPTDTQNLTRTASIRSSVMQTSKKLYEGFNKKFSWLRFFEDVAFFALIGFIVAAALSLMVL